MVEKNRDPSFNSIVAAIIVGISLLILVYILAYYLKIPFEISTILEASFVAVSIFVVITVITRVLRGYLSRYAKASRLHPVIFLINLFGYFVMGVAVLAAFGVNVSSLILGGSLLTVVIGLASQTVLANQFAGVLITITRPFQIGDLVTINTWQYGGIFPTLFPKYFSVDRIEATGYTGTVIDITINYTFLKVASGDTVKLPNGVVVQAAVIVRTNIIFVKARYEIPKYVALDSIRTEVEEAIKGIDGFEGVLSMGVDETTLNTYVMMITAKFKGTDADHYRGSILEKVMEIVEPMKGAA